MYPSADATEPMISTYSLRELSFAFFNMPGSATVFQIILRLGFFLFFVYYFLKKLMTYSLLYGIIIVVYYINLHNLVIRTP